MSVYYYNGSPILAPFSIRSNEPVFHADTLTLKVQRVSQGSQRWELSFNVLTSDNSVDLFVSSLNEIDTAQNMIMPQLKQITDTLDLSGSPVCSTTAAGSTTVTITGGGGILKKGYFIKFSNHSKIYVVLTDTTLTNSGVSLSIYPKLRTGVTNTTTVLTKENATFSYFRNIDNIGGITFSDGILSSPGTVDLIEAI